MKVGIFGGAFNPPHKMHKRIAIELLEKKYLDKIIYVPTGNNYNKPGLLDGNDRLELLRFLIEECKEKIEVSDFEVKGSLYTINTLNHFREIYPKDEIYFICGTDNLAEFDTWHKYEEILENYKLLVIARKDNNFNDIINKYSKYANNIELAQIDMQVISSTMIRNKILNNGLNDELSEFLDNKIIEYLKEINFIEIWSKNNK